MSGFLKYLLIGFLIFLNFLLLGNLLLLIVGFIDMIKEEIDSWE